MQKTCGSSDRANVQSRLQTVSAATWPMACPPCLSDRRQRRVCGQQPPRPRCRAGPSGVILLGVPSTVASSRRSAGPVRSVSMDDRQMMRPCRRLSCAALRHGRCGMCSSGCAAARSRRKPVCTVHPRRGAGARRYNITVNTVAPGPTGVLHRAGTGLSAPRNGNHQQGFMHGCCRICDAGKLLIWRKGLARSYTTKANSSSSYVVRG